MLNASFFWVSVAMAGHQLESAFVHRHQISYSLRVLFAQPVVFVIGLSGHEFLEIFSCFQSSFRQPTSWRTAVKVTAWLEKIHLPLHVKSSRWETCHRGPPRASPQLFAESVGALVKRSRQWA